jgi:hypothetical protein
MNMSALAIIRPNVQLFKGLRVGSVELLQEVEPRDSIKGDTFRPQWEVICDCGRHAFRVRDRIVHAVRYNEGMCCSECASELWRGILVLRKEQLLGKVQNRFETYLKMFREYGSLYSAEFGSVANDGDLAITTVNLDDPTYLLGYQEYEQDRLSGNGRPKQQDQWLFELKGKGGWECQRCFYIFTEGFGCVRCLSHVCPACKTGGHHQCITDWWGTWDDEVKDDGLLERRLNLLKKGQLKKLTAKQREESFRKWKKQLKYLEKEELRRLAEESR